MPELQRIPAILFRRARLPVTRAGCVVHFLRDRFFHDRLGQESCSHIFLTKQVKSGLHSLIPYAGACLRAALDYCGVRVCKPFKDALFGFVAKAFQFALVKPTKRIRILGYKRSRWRVAPSLAKGCFCIRILHDDGFTGTVVLPLRMPLMDVSLCLRHIMILDSGRCQETAHVRSLPSILSLTRGRSESNHAPPAWKLPATLGKGDLTQNKPQITQSSIWLPRVERGTYVSPANQADGGEYQTGCGHGGRRRSRRHRPAATKE